LTVFADFFQANLVPLVAVAVGTVVLAHRFRRLALPAGVVLLYAAYSVWVGGDAWEMHNNVRANRFLSFAMPMVFLLWNALVSFWVQEAPSNSDDERDGAGSKLLRTRLVTAGATAAFFLFLHGLWLSSRPEENWKKLTLTERPFLVTSHALVLQETLRLRRLARPGAQVATVWAGIPAYFTAYSMVDILGYNDREIARSASRVDFDTGGIAQFTPGHVKWDNERLLSRQRPDVIFQVWGLTPEEQATVMPAHGYEKLRGFWVRGDSDRVRR
jgi:hypothetical protein